MEFKKDLGNWDVCLSNLIQLVRLHKGSMKQFISI